MWFLYLEPTDSKSVCKVQYPHIYGLTKRTTPAYWGNEFHFSHIFHVLVLHLHPICTEREEGKATLYPHNNDESFNRLGLIFVRIPGGEPTRTHPEPQPVPVEQLGDWQDTSHTLCSALNNGTWSQTLSAR